MNKRKLETHLRTHGCELHHNGAKHDMWHKPATGAQATVPRHKEIPKGTVRSICKQLDVPLPDGF